MSDHSAVPHFSPAQHTSPNQPFSSWLRNQTALFIGQILSLLGVVSFTATFIYYVAAGVDKHSKYITPENIQLWIHLFHIILLGIFIYWLLGILDKNREGDYRVSLTYERIFGEKLNKNVLIQTRRSSKIQLRKFKLYFLYFWGGMFALYFVFTIKTLLEKTKYISPVETKTVYQGLDVVQYLFFPFLTFASNNLGLWLIFCCFTLLFLPLRNQESKRKQKLLVYRSGAMVLLLTGLFPFFIFTINSPTGFQQTYLSDYVTVFYGISGILNAVALALLIARLDSKLIGLKSWLISVLYIYAAIQPLFVIFEQTEPVFKNIKIGVLIVVFISKVYFFFIITYALQTGRMLNYLFCFPTLNARVDSIFENRFQIEIYKEHKEYYFRIKKKDEIVYLSDQPFKSKSSCRKQLVELRELMKEEDSFKIEEEESGGIYWVEVKDKYGNELCYSEEVKSKVEAEELINDSMARIPFCKMKSVLK